MATIKTGRAYHIINAESDTALDLHHADGSSVIGSQFKGSLSQQWIIESVGEGLRTLKCVRNRKYLGYRQSPQANTTAVCVEKAIRWAIVQTEEEDTYRIFIPRMWLQLNLKCSEPGTPIQLSYPLPDRSQTWKIVTPLVANMRIVTYDVQRDHVPDKLTVQDSLKALPDSLSEPKYLAAQGEKPWSTRRIRIAENLLSYKIDIACFQAALVRQVKDLSELFGDDWGWVGVGRNDGIDAGEFSPVFYRKSAFKLLSTDTFWLSNDPFQPSKYPGTHFHRICTVSQFSSNDSGKEFTILNAHPDHESDDQRRLAASMLLVRARYEAVNTSGPVFVIGHFYSPPTGRDSGAYNIMTGSLVPVPINSAFANKYAVRSDELPNFCMLDLRGATPRQNVSTNYATSTGFTTPNDTKEWRRIDYIFGGNNMGWSSSRYFVGTSLADDGVLSSPYRPVFADISI